MTRLFGYRTDPHDERDLLVPRRPLGAAPRPLATHNLVHLRRTRFQEGNSCVGNSAATLLHCTYSRDQGADIDFSAQHLYLHGQLALPGAAELDRQPDGGCFPRDVWKAAQKVGCVLESDWASTRVHTGIRPPPAVAARGLRAAGYDYRRVLRDQAAFLDALVDGPVQIGGSWWESWSDWRPGKVMRAPEPGEIEQGGHAWLALDYDMTGGMALVLCCNSWADWGFDAVNAWNPERPLQSLAWFELDALVPATPAYWSLTDLWALRALGPGQVRA